MTEAVLGSAPRLRVQVTQKHIDEAVARNSNHCMIAEAIKDANPKLKYVSVDLQTIRATDLEKGERYVWLSPRSTQVGIINIDQGVKPIPFGFEMRNGQTIAAGRAARPRGQKTTLRRTRRGSKDSVPDRIGGKSPPRSVGRRRAFGLRSLEY